jgi:hypothetical protein
MEPCPESYQPHSHPSTVLSYHFNILPLSMRSLPNDEPLAPGPSRHEVETEQV